MRVARFLWFLAALAAVFIPTAGAYPQNGDLPELAEHRWRHRVLIVDAPSLDDPGYRAQASAFLAVWSGLLERDLHIITRQQAPAFRVRLVGKDGGVKLDQGTPVSPDELFALIDAMPMRRAEKR